MTTALVTFVHSAERDAARVPRPEGGRFVPRGRFSTAGGMRMLRRLLRRGSGGGFRSGTSLNSVSMPGVDYRPGRSSSV
ncbi:MAG: hypothetical protein ACOH1Y_13140 [Propionicimonas sp.]